MKKATKIIHLSWEKFPAKIKGRIIIAIPATCLFLSIFGFSWLKISLVEDEKWVNHTQEVKLESQRLLGSLIDAQIGVIGYGLTRKNKFLYSYNQAKTSIYNSLNQLKNLVADNPVQTRQINLIQKSINENLEIFQKKLSFQKEFNRPKIASENLVSVAHLYDWLEEEKETMNAARLEINRFIETEENLLQIRRNHQEFYRQIAWFFLWGAALIGISGSLLAWHLFNQLEQELLSREITLKHTNDRLENACEKLQQFTANASHELRSPLAAILSNAQVSLMDLEDLSEPLEGLQKRLEKIVKLTQQMSDLVNNLLLLARHEGVLDPDSLKTIDLIALLKLIESEYLMTFHVHQLKFITNFPEHPIWVKADRNLLGQAITNLLNNAIKYTPKFGSIEIKLSLDSNQALVQVKDTGIGIPHESLAHIFERFYRVDQKRSKKSGGFGLGLAITQQIIHAHGGEIKVSSIFGQGSCFQITLPAIQI